MKEKKTFYIGEKGFNAIGFYQDYIISKDFPLIRRLATALLSLPHSSAAVERVFSKLKLIKNERRNCLHNDTLQSLLISKVNEVNKTPKKEIKEISQFKRKRSSISPNLKEDNKEETQTQTETKDFNDLDFQNSEVASQPFDYKKMKLNQDNLIEIEGNRCKIDLSSLKTHED